MITRYVNTASTAGGDGTTNDTVGANRAFATLYGAEAVLKNDLFADDLEILCCGSVVDATAVNFTGSGQYVTAGHTIYIKGNRDVADGFHGGKWNSGTYIYSPASGGLDVSIDQWNLIIDGIQIYHRSAGFTNCVLLYGSNAYSFTMKNCLFNCSSATTYDAYFSSWYYTGTGIVMFSDCVLSGATKVRYALHFYKNITHKVYNCVINGCQYGVHRTNGTSIAKNCSVFNNNDDFYGTITIDHCASDDGDGTNPIAVSNWADEFHNASYLADVDFSLKNTSVLLDAGVGPSIDSEVPTDDILEYGRSGDTATVGPFEHYFGWTPPVTRLDYRFLKVATDPGLENDGANALRVKVKTGGGILLDSTGLSIDRSQINEVKIIEYTILASDVTSKGFTLETAMANTNQIAMTVYGGLPVNYGSDYTAVDSTTVGWSSLGLDGFIAAGDEVQVTYPV